MKKFAETKKAKRNTKTNARKKAKKEALSTRRLKLRFR
jgi:hypothetical protein